MTDERINTSDDLQMRFAHVMDDLSDTILDDRMATHGHPGLFAHVFAGMFRAYLSGLLATGRPFGDGDTFTIMEMMKVAREAAAPASAGAVYEHAKDAAGYAVLRAAYTLPSATVDGLYARSAAAAMDPENAPVAEDAADEPEDAQEPNVDGAALALVENRARMRSVAASEAQWRLGKALAVEWAQRLNVPPRLLGGRTIPSTWGGERGQRLRSLYV